MGSHARRSSNILLTGLGILGVVTLALLALFTPTNVGAEDAVILHQYSRNLAETGAITYIPSGPHAEGATDFLWMIYIACGLKLHIAPAISTAIANVLSALGIALIWLRLAGEKRRLLSVLAIVGTLILFPQTQAALKGFCVLPFGFTIALTFMWAWRGQQIATALSALSLCLLRPDGIIFALPLILLVALPSAQNKLAALARHLLFFALPGLLYFVWRWHYFGQLLPLPFLVKANAHRVWGLFVLGSVKTLFPYMLFACLGLLLVLKRDRRSWSNTRVITALLLCAIVFYSNMRLDQNINERFFFFVPPSVLLIFAVHWHDPWRLPKPQVIGLTLAACLLLFGVETSRSLAGNLLNRGEWMRLRALGESISDPHLRGTMLSSESGLLPYFSRWEPYDSWGLNTSAYARRIIQPQQVVDLHPDLVILHIPSGNCSISTKPAETARSWANMVANVQSGIALLNRYSTWRVPYWTEAKERRLVQIEHQPADYECWYIHKSYKDAAAIETTLSRFGGSPLE